MPYDSDAGPRRRRGDHRADDRPRLPALGRGRRRARPVRALRREPRAAQRRDAHAPGRVPRDPRPGPAATASCSSAARRSWDEAVELGDALGYRNAQATVLAPTGTISFLMDCDTTGVEPDFSLVKFKELVGGGQMTIVNRTVPLALQTLGYAEAQIEQIEAHLARARHDRRRARPRRGPHGRCSTSPSGERAITHMGHIKMMGAVQPFISRGDLEDGQHAAGVDRRGHRRRLHPGVAPGRQGAGDLPRRLQDRAGAAHRRPGARRRADVEARARRAGRQPRRSPRPARGASGCPASASRSPTSSRSAVTRATSRPACTRTGAVGEIFLTDIGKEGSTLRGMMNSFATAISIALQYGVPLETLVQKFSYMRFEPEGITGNPEIPFAKSMPDYIMRWLASRFLRHGRRRRSSASSRRRSAPAKPPRTRSPTAATRPARHAPSRAAPRPRHGGGAARRPAR